MKSGFIAPLGDAHLNKAYDSHLLEILNLPREQRSKHIDFGGHLTSSFMDSLEVQFQMVQYGPK